MPRPTAMTLAEDAAAPRRSGAFGNRPAGGESLDASLLFRSIYRRRWLAIVTFVLVVVPAAIWIFFQEPVYASHVRLAIDPEPTAPLPFTKGQAEAPPSDVVMQTQREILESRELARQTILRGRLLDVAEFRAPEATPMLRILRALRLHEDPVAPAATPTTDEARANALVGGFQSRMKVIPVPLTRLVDVVFESSDPTLAARAANAIADTFVVEDLEARLGAVKQATTWLEQRLEEQRQRVESSESALQLYKEQQDALAVEDRQNIVVQKLSDLNAAVTRAKTERLLKETTYRQIEEAKGDNAQLETIPVIAANETLQHLRAELATQLRLQVVLSQKYGNLHPEMVKVQSAIDAATAGIERETAKAVELSKNDYLGALANERRLVAALDAQKNEALRLNRQDLEYGRLQREADANRRLYEALLQQTRQAGVSGEFKQSGIRVVDRAEVPPSPVRPERAKDLLLALAVGFLAATGAAFARDWLDPRIKTPTELQDALRLPFLGLLPRVTEIPKPFTGALMSGNPQLAEAVRRIRTTLLLSNPTTSGQTLLVTSAAPAEGKSVITNLLATAFAATHRRTVIIDVDLRRPMVHELIGAKPSPGLTDYLGGRARLDEILRQTPREQLWVITAGAEPDNPAELLGSSKMAELMAELSRSFDWILLDSTPILAVPDALVVAPLCGGLLLVVAAEATSRRDVVRAEAQLALTNRPFAGCVLNRVPLAKHPYYYAPFHNADYESYYRVGG